MPHESNNTDSLRQAWRGLETIARAEVLVLGGGPAGCAAAIAASRAGAGTLLVEQHGFLGGMGTAGLVPAFCPFTDGQKPLNQGIGMEVLAAMKANMPHIAHDDYDWVPIDPEQLKTVYETHAAEAGVRVLLLTRFIDAVCDKDGMVRSVVLHNKSGLRRVDAGVVIDCTGDADLIAAAGAPFEKGDPTTGEMQPSTMCFVLAGVDNLRFQRFLHANGGKNLLLREVIARAKAAGDLDIPENAANVAYQSPTTVGFNFSHVFDVDGTDAEQLSRAHAEGRRLVHQLTDFVRKYCPGCERAYLAATGATLGVRETRRIIGDYVLTLDDYLARSSFPDDIARNSYYIDIHLSQENIGAGGDDIERLHRYEPGESHGIPYRCLIPRGLRNVLTAGRCISTDRAVQGATRIMPVCLATGEAAGMAAARAAARHDGDVRQAGP